MTKKKHAVPTTELSNSLPAKWLPFQTTAKLKPHKGMIGQERAMRAIEVGLNIDTRGFNIFAVGEPGSGKTSTLERILRDRAAAESVPDDLCYVYNFREPEMPLPLMLPAGKGWELAKEMERVVEELTRMIPRVLSEEAFGHIRAGILADTQEKADELTELASAAAKKLDLRIDEEGDNFRVVPLIKGEPIDQDAFEALSAARRRKIESNMFAFQEHMDAFSYGRRQLERKHNDRMSKAEVRAITQMVEGLLGEVSSRFRRYGDAVGEYLARAEEHILENHRGFMPPEDHEGGPESDLGGSDVPEVNDTYKVYVAVDRSEEKGAPVVVERMPSVSNLCGFLEYKESSGGLVTNHTMIRAGALHRANGGYLLIQVGDLLTQDGAWDCLKRSLRHKGVRVDEAGGGEGRLRVVGMMKPVTVPLKLKVILVGTLEAYYYLKTEDEEFGRLFKIKADFEHSAARTQENIFKLAQFLGQVCREEGHLPIHRSGMSELVAYASRRVGHKHRMTTRRADLLDLLAEANFFARQARARSIRGEDVQQAIGEIRYRNNALGDGLGREIAQGTIMIRTEGNAVGQVNGIALYDTLSASFGIPVRITARTYAGKRGVVNIDREVRLSGAIHDKGAMILVGYLGGRFAQEHTLGLSSSITFEQSYDEIDGDSASSAELYALLSALSECPINQGIAVTGSVNQLGEIQPIGGVNEKIDGVFRVCKQRGLTGTQGGLIPKSNVIHLMLDGEVVEAVRGGKFNIFAVSSVDEGIEVLTGVPAGQRNKDGTFQAGTINGLVAARLKSLGEVIRRYGAVSELDREL